MDVTRDSSQRPDNLPKVFPPAVPERSASGSSPLARTTAIRTVTSDGPADSGPATTPLAVVPSPAQAGPADRRDPLETAAPETVELLDVTAAGTATATTSRRPPRADQALREHRAAALPGWIALLAVLIGVAGVLFVLLRTGVIPYWDALPDLRGTVARESGRVEADAQWIAAAARPACWWCSRSPDCWPTRAARPGC